MRQPPAVALTLLLCLAAFAPAAKSQNPFTRPDTPDGRIEVLIVLDENVDAPTLLRREEAAPRNVILMNSANLDPQTLTNAIFSLLVLEARDPAGQQRADNAAHRVSLSSPRPVYGWAAQAVGLLRAATSRHVAALGDRQVVQMWVEPLRGEFRPGRAP